MPSIRDEITKSIVRFRDRLHAQSRAAFGLREHAEVGQYRVVRELGAGGMGQVYLAQDTKLGRLVALKVLAPDLTADKAHVIRFQQEARAASALNHPNILTIYDFCEIDGAQIIVSEFVDGMTLRAALEQELVDVKRAIGIAGQIASALASAHAAGVIHRDLKPTNIMLRPDGYVKVIDFGLAKLASRNFGSLLSYEATLTRPGSMVGTVRYMSPEQARGEEVDHRGDVWSLGVVLYEMTTGAAPFEGVTDNHLIVNILDAPPRPIPQGVDLPPGLDVVLKRALAKDKRDRYQFARDFASDLDALQIGTRPGVPLPQHRRAKRRGWLLPGALVCVLAGILFLWGPLRHRWNQPDWFEVTRADRLTFSGDVKAATVSPNGKWLAYASGPNGSEVLHLRPVSGGPDVALRATDQLCDGLTFSPDSQTLFVVLRDDRREQGALFSIPVKLFGHVPQALRLSNIDGPIAFSPNGASFAFLRRQESKGNSTIFVAPLSDVRQERVVYTFGTPEVYGDLSWSSAGIAAIAFPSRVGKTSQATVYLVSPEGKQIAEISSPEFRRLHCPVLGGSSLYVSGQPRSSSSLRLEQISLRSGEWRSIASDLAGFDQASLSANGSLLAGLRSTRTSSVWVAERDALNNARRVVSGAESFSSLAWLGNDRLVIPMAQPNGEDLAAVDLDGHTEPLSHKDDAFEQDPATTPGRAEVVFSSNAASGGNEFNIWKLAPGSQPVMLTGGPNEDTYPQLSPDGQWVLYTSYASGNRTLWRVPLGGGLPQQFSSEHVRRTGVLSPDGKRVVCQSRVAGGNWHGLILSFPQGEVLQRILDLPPTPEVRWSPDGAAIDFIDRDGDDWVIRRQPLAGGSRQVLLRVPGAEVSFFAWSGNGTKLAYVVSHAESDVVLLHKRMRE